MPRLVEVEARVCAVERERVPCQYPSHRVAGVLVAEVPLPLQRRSPYCLGLLSSWWATRSFSSPAQVSPSGLPFSGHPSSFARPRAREVAARPRTQAQLAAASFP